MNLRKATVCGLIGVLTLMMGYPVFDFNTHVFSSKNLMIVIFATGIAILMMTDEK